MAEYIFLWQSFVLIYPASDLFATRLSARGWRCAVITGDTGFYNRQPSLEGCPYRFVLDEWLEHGLPPKTDPRRFTFVIICNHCKARKNTLQEMRQHFKICPNKTSHPDLTCGHCRYTTQCWAHMCVHLNQLGCIWKTVSPRICFFRNSPSSKFATCRRNSFSGTRC